MAVRALKTGLGLACALALAAGAGLAASLRPLPERLVPPVEEGLADQKLQIVARNGEPLTYTYAGGWNVSEQLPLHRVPWLLQRAFVEAEDQRFYSHSGVDWRARLHALWQNLAAGRVVRGASTISEQVVRMLHPRPRSAWARLAEGIEAAQLERRFSKGEILEFYLNQVPYAARRRGVAQAARHYFGRDLETLSEREALALAVMVRAPRRLDLYRGGKAIEPGVEALAERMIRQGAIERAAWRPGAALVLEGGAPPLEAGHFVGFVQREARDGREHGRVVTTIDPVVQRRAQQILDARVGDLARLNVTDGALLIVDNRSAEVVAWVNAGGHSQAPGSQFDGVVTPRQPGSALKPLLYALALSRGWNAATVLEDSPLLEAVGSGLHNFRNYSRVYYGPVTVREALGNSLNVPAVRAIHFTGVAEFLEFLRLAGFRSLDRSPDFYGEGLALGNGEVTLYELVQGYLALASHGVWRPLRVVPGGGSAPGRRLVSPEVSSIVGDILSDSQARRREFGSGGLMSFPTQTAIKTGTSTDFRDAWAVGFSDAFTVGVWLGNMNRSAMREVSGARGPALVLRGIFAELERDRETKGLFLSPRLERHLVCPVSGELAGAECARHGELFVPGTAPAAACRGGHNGLLRAGSGPRRAMALAASVVLPTAGLNIAMDPRIPDEREAFPLEAWSPAGIREVRWIVDGREVSRLPGASPRYLWPLSRGHHVVRAEIVAELDGSLLRTGEVGFWVR